MLESIKATWCHQIKKFLPVVTFNERLRYWSEWICLMLNRQNWLFSNQKITKKIFQIWLYQKLVKNHWNRYLIKTHDQSFLKEFVEIEKVCGQWTYHDFHFKGKIVCGNKIENNKNVVIIESRKEVNKFDKMIRNDIQPWWLGGIAVVW